MHRNLRSFMALLERERDLVAIEAEVEPYLELAEIHRRVIARGGPALLFKRVRGSRYAVVTNLFGTTRRIELAFGPKPERLVRDVVRVAESLLPPRPRELWQHRALALEALRLGTRRVRRAPVLEVIDRPARLDELPVLTTWQEDGGPFITLPLVYTEHPTTKKHNLGIYRMQVYDATAAGLHWQIQKGGGFHYHAAEQVNQSLPVTVFLGGPPALIISAIAPLPEDFFIGDYLQSLLSPIFPLVMPGVRDLWSYGETGFHSLAAAVVRERYAREALVSGFRILGEGQLALTKFLILTDSLIDLRDFRVVLEHVLARVRWETDFFIFSNTSMDTLDYTSGKVNEGSKAILMGLGDPVRDLPREFRGELPNGVSSAEVFGGACLVVQVARYLDEPDQAA